MDVGATKIDPDQDFEIFFLPSKANIDHDQGGRIGCMLAFP